MDNSKHNRRQFGCPGGAILNFATTLQGRHDLSVCPGQECGSGLTALAFRARALGGFAIPRAVYHLLL